MTAVVVLTERARSARRTNILVAIVVRTLMFVSLGMFLIALSVMGDGLTTDLGPIYTSEGSCISI
jgi:CHASE2 domain-containing sensor protein